MKNNQNFCDSTIFLRSPDALHADLEGETVMMSVERGEYFGLNSVGARVWALLETPQSLDQLCAALVTEYTVNEEQCREEVSVFLKEMLRLGIVSVRA